MKFLHKRLPKKLKDFAHKRQVKLVSTLLEPSIPFHTLVRHVDSEDIAHEKIRTNDLAPEINKISIENDINDKELEPDHIIVSQPGDPNNKSKPAYKKYCSYCQKTITVFQIAIKNNVTKNTKDLEIRDQELLNNLLYNTSVVNPAILKITELKIKLIILLEIMTVIDIVKTTPTIVIDIEIKIDTEVTVEIINNYRSNSRQRYYNRSQSPYSSRSRYDNHYQRRTPSRSPYRSPYRNNTNHK